MRWYLGRRKHTGRRDVSFRVGMTLLVIITLLCVFVPFFAAHGPSDIVADAFQHPSWQHPFGTDSVGRDVFVRVFAGGRLDLVIASVVVLASLLIGTIVGALAGATDRNWIETLLMRFVDALLAFPFIVLVLALVVVFGQERTMGPLPAGAPAIMVAILFIDWAVYARLARSQMRVLRTRDYVVAVQVLGLPHRRILRRHLLPAVARVGAAYAVADAILVVITIASLSFLGLGVQPPTAEWGSIMYEGRSVLATSWWVTVTPGIVLAVAGLSLTLVADSMLASDGRSS
jgi:peptide/nickel transport system permease protein